MNAKMDPERHCPQITISHCIISNETQITMHFFQGRLSAMPEMTAGLFLAMSKTGMCLLTWSCFKRFYFCWFPAGQGFKKVGFRTFLKVS